MSNKKFPKSNLPIRKTSDFLPNTFQTPANDKFLSGVFDPLIQPGTVDKLSGYIGRRYGKTYKGNDVYLDSDETLRSRYQLEPGVTVEKDQQITDFYDYLDFKNILKFFGNNVDRDDKTTYQEHYTWNPPLDWDKFVNYREYYWSPLGVPSVPIQGQAQGITSTYKVNQGVQSTWVFTPDGFTNNPTLTLYRGQTYNFQINSPGERFTLRTNYDTGSLSYQPLRTYFTGELAVYNGNLWRAKVEVSPADGSSIDLNSEDWELVDTATSFESLLYNNGVTNNGIEVGTLTFEVPQNAPDVVYYQSDVDPNRLGRFIIADIDENTFINVDNEIKGKTNYTSANDIKLSNGMLVEFRGQVEPEKYKDSVWLIEGVGKNIELIKFDELVPPTITSDVPEVLFDNEGFDTQPFDDAAQYPAQKDYVTINRASKDNNPWSRYNRWFHRSVLEYAYKLRGSDFNAPEELRAKRPIIEFHPGIQLFNHGGVAKQTVDYVDDYTTDVFSTIEGSTGYSVDGEFLFQGARVLVTADTDNLANNKIYQVDFITHNNRRQISLKETSDTLSVNNECVLVRRGNNNAGKMYHFNGENWIKSQEKTTVNQSPLFDGYDLNGISYADKDTYPVSTFVGSPILSYGIGNGPKDVELGFALSYLNIDNVGDIQFNWNWDIDRFTYTTNQQEFTVDINSGYYKINNALDNGWQQINKKYLQPIVDSVVVEEDTSTLNFNNIDWENLDVDVETVFYLNDQKIENNYTRNGNSFVFEDITFKQSDTITIKTVGEIEPHRGYYEIPLGLEHNPLNTDLNQFTLGQATDHVKTSLEFDTRFEGKLPGASNLRDLSDFQKNAKRFLKHSGISAAALLLLTDKNNNLIKSLQYAKKQYSVFRDNFLKKSLEIDFIDNTADMVDSIIEELTKTKSENSPFADSDMIGSGAYTAIEYNVKDIGTKTFSLTEQFDLDNLSRRAVYVYINDAQLLFGKDYDFNSTFSYLNLKVDLAIGDKIIIREYVSTAACHIPPTPTALGLYKKYTPMKFLDDTYKVDTNVIQGHDGSIEIAYDDFRDDLLLELEYRIYNNIKQQYDYNVFDIDANFAGYYGNALFNKAEQDSVTNQEFLRWVANTNLSYTANNYFEEGDTFSYTYSNMTTPDGLQNLPGWWRGVYQYAYDTDRPHRCPWEMLGFSEKPDWWEDEYGPAPYTSGNLILWEDIRDGLIKHGNRKGIHKRYARPSILNHIPVDADGNLLSPLASNFAREFALSNAQGDFKLGDVNPVEYAYRSSCEYPFVKVIALSLLRPFEFIISNFDKNKTARNNVGQIVDKVTNVFLKPNDLKLPVAGDLQTSGLVNYIAAYIKGSGNSISDGQEMFSNINVRLTSRLSGFVDTQQQKYLLDSKNPNSSSSSIFIPAENVDIIFNVSSPIVSLTYSGVVIEKTNAGWSINGYDDVNPYFNYYEPIINQKDPVISVGGVSEAFTFWQPGKVYNNGALIEYNNVYYRAIQTHTSAATFESNQWQKLPELPSVGATVAQRRRQFNTIRVSQLSYGTELTELQQVVDLLLGYQAYLQSQGFVFENYNRENRVVQDFLTASKEFMFWTTQNWSVGSLLTLSPGAESIEIRRNVGVGDNLLDSFYDYNILQSNGQPLEINNIDVKRDYQSVKISTFNTTQGMYYLKVNYVLKEHVTIFNDRTVFNDVIFDKPTGYRQERIKSIGFRTVDWDGDYTSPGFLFDNVSIDPWQPFKDYRLGDIVKYKSKNYTSRFNHTSGENFDDNRWTILDSNPQKQLIPNYDYRINQIDDYFDVASEGLGQSQRDLARHTIGYQTRDYLQNLAEDEITQLRLYQGFIREKGTNNSITKLFDKIGRAKDAGVELNEEWAFKVGELGGNDQAYNIELELKTDNFEINPQPVLVVENKNDFFIDRYYRVAKDDFDFAPVPYTTDVNPTINGIPERTAGYVKVGQAEFTVKHKDDILDLDIDSIQDNSHIWVTFYKQDWTVFRANYIINLPFYTVSTKDTNVTVEFQKPHNLQVDDLIGIPSTLEDFKGIYKITSVTPNTVTFVNEEKKSTETIDVSTISYPLLFTEARYKEYDDIKPETVALLKEKGRLFVDNNSNGLWEVTEKNNQYVGTEVVNFGVTEPRQVGTKVLFADLQKQTIASMPQSGQVVCYVETTQGLNVKQILTPADAFVSSVNGTWGQELAISPDYKWLAVGSPLASGVRSNFQGVYSPLSNYAAGDIVLYAGNLWKANSEVIGDGSSINVYSNEWEIAQNIQALASGSNADGYPQQGMITLYEYAAQQWNLVDNFISPFPASDKYFGKQVSISKDGNNYYMAVSAPGTEEIRGKVYLYKNINGAGWEFDQNESYRGEYSAGGLVDAIDIIPGRTYTISYVGDTNFVDIGAEVSEVGREFVATQSGTGSGVVIEDSFYPKDSVVYHEGYLWRALADNAGDGSSIDVNSNDWIRLEPTNTSFSLPQSVALEDDGSTLGAGLLTDDQIAELIKEGDLFGNSLAASYNGDTLVVGAPQADGQFFTNYRGPWRENHEYIQNDTVFYNGGYHQLVNEGLTAVGADSSIRSYGQSPEDGLPWIPVGDSSAESVGKAFVYKKDSTGYKLIQTITAESLDDINDTGIDETISSGDRFAYDVAVDWSGNTVVVTSPEADKNFQNQGSAYVFRYETDSTQQRFLLKQKLESYSAYPNEFFGQSICISPDTGKIVIGAKNTSFNAPLRFDNSQTSFDNDGTRFNAYTGYAGAVYVFEKKDSTYFLAERLEEELSLNESFGTSVDCAENVIVVGSPDYISPASQGSQIAFDGDRTGMVRLFKKDPNKQPLTVIGQQTPIVKHEGVKRIALYDTNTDVKIQDLEIVDPAKLKILAVAERNISYKTIYDPAVYTNGTEETNVDEQIAWFDKNVGKLWWNLSNAKWLHYEQADTAYRLANWGKLAEGASIDVYEWVESKLLPSEWSGIADTNEGLQIGISGQPLYPNDDVYSIRILYNPTTLEPTETLYYYWVKGKTTIPSTVDRTESAASVSNLINNPQGLGNTFIALADKNKFILYNYTSIVNEDRATLNIEYYNSSTSINNVHNEYQLLTEGDPNSIPTKKLENKWLDSLAGYDNQGNRVPDPDLPEKQKYGVLYRPRQSMFVNRKPILSIMIEHVNKILMREAFADSINFTNLNLVDPAPDVSLQLYDTSVESVDDLVTVGTVRVKQAVLSVNIIDSEVSSITIVDPGFGYKPTELFDQEVPGVYLGPKITIQGDGTGAEAISHIDSQGRITAVAVTNKGSKYSSAEAIARRFSVLVKSDSTANNYWSIYAWDDIRKTFFRSASQGFDTTKYWNYKDWWKEGFGPATRIIKEISDVSVEPSIEVKIDDLIRVKEYGSGGWAVFRKIEEVSTELLGNYELVGRYRGTIELSKSLYDIQTSAVGYDNNISFDTGLYDIEPTQELRNVFSAIKEDILVGDYLGEWNYLFFESIRYVFYEQTYVDWAFKTSFLNAVHNVGGLEQRPTYRNDSLDSYLDYVNEVKPYRTTVREYISKYDEVENNYTGTTDFDLPVVYNEAAGKNIVVTDNSDELAQYPWKWWADNQGFGIIEINVSAQGSGYVSTPQVVIEGNGTGATAEAFISNGKVSGIRVTNKGSGYTTTPTVSLVGGNGNSTNIAKAVAILGDAKARTFDISVKFDRISKDGLYTNFTDSQTFVASGTTAVFDLKYAPTRDKTKISLTLNDQLVLGNEYNISLYKSSTDTFGLLKGKIIFVQAPDAGDVIKITYDKNDELYDSVNRIEKSYNPISGMKGKDLNQLMTGMDFGGVQIQGTTFDVTGGWDALPWFTDSWDSVETSADYYHVCDGSTEFVTLPYVPADGQEINVYLKRAGESRLPTIDNLQYSDEVASPKVVRIDDPYFLSGNDSSTSPNPNAQMPTFVGDGANNIVEIGQYITVNDGDILIFRPVESDGSVTITDPNIVDTNLSGGTLSRVEGAYVTATGTDAENINIDGGTYIEPDQVPAPEENIPGQVLDSLSIKVYNTVGSGAATLQSNVTKIDGSTTTYEIGQNVLEAKSIVVYVDGVKQVLNTDYNVDLLSNTVEFSTAPDADSTLEILSIGIGGVAILDYQEFLADGDTSLFLTNANYSETTNVFVTVNGVEKDVIFQNSTGIVDSESRTLVEFPERPAFRSTIKIVCLGAATDVDSSLEAIVRVNSQKIIHDGSTRSYDLDNFVQLTRESSVSSMIVELNNKKLRGVDTIYEVFDGTNKSFVLGIDPEEPAGAILSANVRVYVNGVLKTFIQDYTYDGAGKTLTYTSDLTDGDIIKIENNLRAEYSIDGSNLVLSDTVTLDANDVIDVTWFSEYPSLTISADEVTGGKVVYKLPFKPLSASYIWVYKNGVRLTKDIDYNVELPRGVLYLEEDTDESDLISVVSFGSNVFRLPSAYEVNKDMLNIYRYNRFVTTDVVLDSDLQYYDKEIKIKNGSNIFNPIKDRNIPGIVVINNEKIEYFEKDGNTLKQLRRGVQGTAIAETHVAGSAVVDQSISETIPYTETQERTDFISDGSSLLIGPLDYTPKATTTDWETTTIPTGYGRCDSIEVFVGGKRLRKTPLVVFDETIGATSPAGDKTIEAEFSVNGTDPYVRLTDLAPAGTRITIIKRQGQTWYDRGESTVTSGVTLLENQTPISKFIAAKTTQLPE